MEFKIQVSAGDEFYIMCFSESGNHYADSAVANELHITKNQYQNILKKYGALKTHGDCYFTFIEQAVHAIEELDSIVILNKLTEA